MQENSRTSEFDNDDLLTIESDPIGDVDVFGKSFNYSGDNDEDWLCVAIDGYYLGEHHVLRKTWLQSGKNGWNNQIYDWS